MHHCSNFQSDTDSAIQGYRNNRGITHLPITGKVFEKVTFGRHSKWGEKNDSLDPLLLKEVKADNVEGEITVYVSMLYTEKAFDTGWVEGLLYMRHRAGMDPILWRLLKESYADFSCDMHIYEKLSQPLTAGQGVHQGVP